MPEPKIKTIQKSRGIVSDSVRSHADDPVFVKKNAEAKEAISKIDFSVIKEK